MKHNYTKILSQKQDFSVHDSHKISSFILCLYIWIKIQYIECKWICVLLQCQRVQSGVVRRNRSRCAAADSWRTTGRASRGFEASLCSGHFQSVWPRCVQLWCPPAGPGGRPLCILLLSGTGNRHRHSSVRLSGQLHCVMWSTSQHRAAVYTRHGAIKGWETKTSS